MTLIASVYMVVAGLVLGLIAWLTAWIPPHGSFSYLMGALWSRGVLRTSGVGLEATVDSAVAADGSYIYMANHQSLFDIPVMMTTVPGPFRFMAKKSLFHLPFFGWAMRAAGTIGVDREDRASARQTFTQAMEQLQRGNSVIVFPEETRSLDGRLLPFRKGGFLLALRGGVPIVPVGIRGTLAIRRRGDWVIRPGNAEIHYGAPIDSREFGVGRRGELESLVRGRIAALAGLDGETGAA